jgi:hypothetical protein
MQRRGHLLPAIQDLALMAPVSRLMVGQIHSGSNA